MELINNELIPTNGRACEADIRLLSKVLKMLNDRPIIVQLGAGENFSMAVFKEIPRAILYSVDVDEDAFNWETRALETLSGEYERNIVLSESSAYAGVYEGPKIDLLIIDADHTYEGVLSDLKAWAKHMKGTHYIFLHDYDAVDAPYYYEGVKKACDEFFKKRFSWRSGWSVVWRMKGG